MPPSPSCKACALPLGGIKSFAQKNDYGFLRCPACATVTISPFPTPEQLTAYYQAYTGTTDYAAKQEKKIRRAQKRIRRLMKRVKGKSFLDVGCNHGFAVKAALNLGLDAHGIDVDADTVATAAKLFGPHFTAAAVQDYAAQGKKADIIYTSEVIEHVPDPDSFTAALAKILNPGGVLYLTTPDGGHWRVPRDFTQWEACIPPEHVVYFTRKGLSLLFGKHGLKIMRFAFALKPGLQLWARLV